MTNRNTSASQALYNRSCQRIPGGVNSPVRSFRGVGGQPLFFTRGEAAYLFDVDDNRYLDFVCSWGAMIVGHAQPAVIAAVTAASENSLGFGAPTERECQFAETLCAALPALDMVRAVNSGTEATMSAIRLARGFTQRDSVVKFSGCYHGHADSLLIDAGSGVMTLGIPSSAGVTKNAIADTLILPYNNSQALADLFKQRGDQIAAVIVEPIAGNMNMIPAHPEFLQTLRDTCNQYGSVLIFDEVMSGFRVHQKGAQGLFNISPDLICLGKVIGGGLNVAAFGGREDIMRQLAPLGTVYQAGTLSGNPVALAAGLATLDIVLADGFFEELTKSGERLCCGLSAAARRAGIAFSARSIGGMFGLYFRAEPPENFEQVNDCDVAQYRRFFHAMLANGVYLAPSAYEAGFLSSAHTVPVIEEAMAAAENAFSALAQQ